MQLTTFSLSICMTYKILSQGENTYMNYDVMILEIFF